MIILFGSAILLLGADYVVAGQVRVYNPGIYNRTRRLTINRAANKAALKKARQRKALRNAVKKSRRRARIKKLY